MHFVARNDTLHFKYSNVKDYPCHREKGSAGTYCPVLEVSEGCIRIFVLVDE